MSKLNFVKTWCDYLTPCPHLNKEHKSFGRMVGDYDCYNCTYCQKFNDTIDEKYVMCSYEEV